MTQTDLDLQRLFNQRIVGATLEQPEAVVRWMGAIQAQDYAQAVWAIGLRTNAAPLAHVEQAIADRKIVRTWPMRGTLHFVPPEDAKWMLRFSAARNLAMNRHREERLGLNDAIFGRSHQFFYDALKGGGRLSRPDMLNLLENAGIRTENQRGYHILWVAAQTGLICMGPLQGKQQTFVLLDEWAPDARALSREEALAVLARRYFTSHGPATLKDFAWWAGLTLGDARSGLAAAGSGLVSKTVNENEYWLAGDTLESAANAPVSDPASVHLLPGFDEYLLGYTDRGVVLASDHAAKIIPGGNGIFRPMLVSGGQVSGAWKRSIKKNGVEITLYPFTPLAVPQESLFQAAQGYTDFLGLPLSAMVSKMGD